MKKISLQLAWLDQFQFAGFYIAKEKGFYKDFGLDIEFKKFDKTISVVDEVLEKRADFGLGASTLIVDKSKGKDVVLLGSVFQTSPLMLLSLKESNINSLEDIKDKYLMSTKEQLEFATFKGMLISKKIDINRLNIVEQSFNVDDLINKKTDLMLAYSTNEPYLLKEKGFDTKIFHPKDYGFNFYEDLIFTTSEYIKNNSQIVEDFYNASIKGWEYAFDNIDETVKLIHKKYNSQNKSLEALTFEANEMKKLVFDKNGDIGTITPERINLMINTYKVMGLLNEDIDIGKLIYTKTLDKNISFEENEKEYLLNKRKIKMCVDPDWMPIEKIENNKHMGIAADYIKVISEKIKIPIELVLTQNWSDSLTKVKQGDCDILSGASSTPERIKYLNFTKSYISTPLVIVTNSNSEFIDDMKQVEDKKIAVVKDYAHTEIFKMQYPNIDIIIVPNVTEGLKLVERGEAFGFIGDLLTTGYQIQNNFIGQLKISGKINHVLEFSIAVRNQEEILKNIMDKAIDNISSEQKHKILNKWISVNYQNKLDYQAISKIIVIAISVIILFFIIYRQYLLKRMNKKLNERINIEIRNNEEKNRLLIQQSKMISMGELLENIAHQWRQPLSIISVCASGMELKKRCNDLEDEEFFKSINYIKNTTKYLSNTIDDFRSFLSQDKAFTEVNISNIINKVMDLLIPSFDNYKIEIVKDIEEVRFYSLENELIQALMNIIVNAKDALKLIDNERRIIYIVVEKEDNNLIIKIKDNGGGIQTDIINKIYEPYFTTKHKSQGTGIGLYMVKLLVEKHLKGSINASNVIFNIEDKEFEGTEFTIILPIDNPIK